MTTHSTLSVLAAAALALGLAGCTTSGDRAAINGDSPVATAYASTESTILDGGPLGPVDPLAYAAAQDGGFNLPAIPVEKIDPRFLRQRVVYDGMGFAPGTVVVDTGDHFLYVIESRGTAMRYGIGIGKAGFLSLIHI